MLSLVAFPVLAETPLQFETLAREAQAITDVVLAQHVDPPTRQEMWLTGTKAMLATAGVVDRAGLSAEISRLTTHEQFAAFLKDLWTTHVVSEGHQSAPAQKQAFLDGMLEIVPGGATFISRKELAVEEQFQGNRYIGTGIALGYDDEKKYPRIANVIPGGPMQRAGGRAGDLILKIDDRDAHGLGVMDMVDLLRGPEATSTTLVVGPTADDPRTIVVTRGPVVLPTLQGLREGDDKQWDYRVEPWLPIRYVNVTQINGSTVHDLRQLERQFRAEDVQAVILDFRSHFAQDLHHTLLLADALMDGGLIGRVRTGRNVREYRADRECLFRDWPLAVLVDQNTRGGGEWIAAALQDNHAAVIVGRPTGGIAHVRTAVLLPDNDGAVQLDTAIFERPSGRSLAKSMSSNPERPRRRPTPDEDDQREADQPSGGVIPDLPKPAEPAPGVERPTGEARRQAPIRPQVAHLDEEGMLKIAVLELRARLDAGEGRSPR